MSIFGAICSGRPMILAEQVDQTKFVINVPNASNINYITIFILPNSPFVDNNFTALIYFQLPQQQNQTLQSAPEFKLLGGINPSKPSAIYKVSNLTNSQNITNAQNQDGIDLEMNDSGPIDLNDSVSINIGISIEPTPQAEQLIQQSKQQNSTSLVSTKPQPQPSKPSDTAQLANKIVGNAYNYLASFIDNQGKVPIKAFDNWWDKFKTKLQNNPNFLNEISE
ncbi:uncharacterized protein KGF55_003745 [Candida pseudojiufengensis]|uniref:uncharacterized protein n=1 Tax=Candida pseudojiufengensis TaxID=497109 RepID=UPI002224AD2D|nr:uncharacterized protein KGF55_003745 [Candida pseudojiufengensis]KAI5962669.1 hypothetical protein KGF55_003745 [Candida pseudojiufengensis]